jgi:PAS domain S-box-containing protein
MSDLSDEKVEITALKDKLIALEAELARTQQELAASRRRIKSLERQYQECKSQLDLTVDEQRDVQNVIERAKKEWESTVDAVADMIVLTEPDGRIIRCNHITTRYLNKSYGELIGKFIHSVFLGNNRKQSTIFDIETKEVQLPAMEGWFDIFNYPVIVNGTPYGMVHVIKDVTEWRKAKQSLRESQDKLKKINDELEIRVRQRTMELIQTNQELQREIRERENIQAILAKEKETLSITLLSIRDGVISTDDEGTIILFNKAAESITGYQQDEVLGKSLNDVIKILDVKNNQIQDNPLTILLNPKSAQRQGGLLTLINRQGDRLLITNSSAPIKNESGHLMGYVMVINDVTERRRIEEQLALFQKMESIGQLAAGIAHEINTPMQYVGDNTHFLNDAFNAIKDILNAYEQIEACEDPETRQIQKSSLQQLKDELDVNFYISEVPDAIQQSLDGIERVRKIVLAMKAFAHPSHKEKRLADINQGIETTVTISRNEWKYNADLEMELDPDLPMVTCEIDEINQVILNMIINAAQAIQEAQGKHSEEKGRISIKTLSDDDHILIKIQDTGIGIPQENLNRIFDPFFTTKDVGVGTGQGLSLAHNVIVKQHHGEIMVDSELGKGTTFTIRLPIQEQEAAAQEETR